MLTDSPVQELCAAVCVTLLEATGDVALGTLVGRGHQASSYGLGASGRHGESRFIHTECSHFSFFKRPRVADSRVPGCWRRVLCLVKGLGGNYCLL